MRKKETVRAAARVLSLCVAVAWVGGCNEHALAPVEEGLSAEIQITTPRPGVDKFDILWVVDNSRSMCEEQIDLSANFGAFVQRLDESGSDFRLAVITTDMMDPAQAGRFQNVPSDVQDPFCTQNVDISHCPTENGLEASPRVISSTDLRYRLEDGSLDRALMTRDFGCSATVGTQGTGFEQGLAAMKAALSPELLSGHNSGFLREDAYLAVIFFTDENDCSGLQDTTNGSNCEWHPEQLDDVQGYVDFLVERKGGDPSRVFIGGILGPDAGLRFAPGDPVSPSCVSEHGEAYAGYRYEALARSFESSSLSNICAPPFDDTLSDLSARLVSPVDHYCLPNAPQPGQEPEVILTRPLGRAVEGADCQRLEDDLWSRCVLTSEHYSLEASPDCPESGWGLHIYPLQDGDGVSIRYRQAVGSAQASQSTGSGLRSTR